VAGCVFGQGGDFNTCIENIDIGGPSMLRSSSKNHQSVVICTSPAQYPELMKSMEENTGCTLLPLRKRFAASAFATSAAYDAAISSWFSNQLGESPPKVCRVYTKAADLKYGCNPHQKPAGIYSVGDKTLPFNILNGAYGGSLCP
jgi:phosphoribosylaminoimidazolecarboxamide formyltransferase/IMP cyclohydrolase